MLEIAGFLTPVPLSVLYTLILMQRDVSVKYTHSEMLIPIVPNVVLCYTALQENMCSYFGGAIGHGRGSATADWAIYHRRSALYGFYIHLISWQAREERG